MKELFNEILSKEGISQPRSVLLLCISAGHTLRYLKDHLDQCGYAFKCESPYSHTLQVGLLKITVQYVTSTSRWVECLRGTCFNNYYSLVELNDEAVWYVKSRVRPNYNWLEPLKSVPVPVEP